MKRILVVANEAHRTGAPLVAVETARALSDGADVTVVVKRGDALVPIFEHVSGRVIQQPMGWLEPWISRARFRGLSTGTRRLELRTAQRVVSEVQPDVIYAHTVEVGDYIRAGRELGIPTVLHLHEPRARAVEFLAPTGIDRHHRPTVIVGCSRQTSGDAAAYFDLTADCVVTIPEPVNVDEVIRRSRQPLADDLPGTDPLVLTVGSVTHAKGADLWVEVVAGVVARRNDVRFAWIGDGRERQWLESEVRRRGLEERALVLGARENPIPYLASAQALLVTSRFEGMPLVVLEALSVGTVCVGFGVNGVPDAIGPHGRTCSPERPDLLQDALLTILDDPDIRGRVRAEGEDRARALFDVRRFHAKTREVVQPLLRRESVD